LAAVETGKENSFASSYGQLIKISKEWYTEDLEKPIPIICCPL